MPHNYPLEECFPHCKWNTAKGLLSSGPLRPAPTEHREEMQHHEKSMHKLSQSSLPASICPQTCTTQRSMTEASQQASAADMDFAASAKDHGPKFAFKPTPSKFTGFDDKSIKDKWLQW